MPECLYLFSPTLEIDVDVLECMPCNDGMYAIRLNETPFHPQGGGQPSDIGWLNDVEVVHVAQENGKIIHYTAQPVPVGTAHASVNAEYRQTHSRLHSAGHLIGHIVEEMGWLPIKAHHWPGECQVVFKPGPEAPSVPDIEVLQKACEQLISDNLPRHTTLHDNGFREVGFGRFSPYPCGGTHVVSLAELRNVQVQAIKTNKGLLSVKYDVVTQ